MIAFLTGGIRRLFQENGKTKEAAALENMAEQIEEFWKKEKEEADRPEKRIKLMHCFLLSGGL